jgi:outer membrane protein assembly factor BamB
MNRDTMIRNRWSVAEGGDRTGALGMVAGGGLLVVAASMGPATWRQGEAHAKPAVAVLVTIVLLGPLLSAITATTTTRRATAAVAGLGSVIAAALAVGAAVGEATRDGLAPGGPLAAVGATLAAGGWLIVVLTAGSTARFSWTPLAAATVLTVLIGWWGPVAATRLAASDTDDRTVDAVPSAPLAPPGGIADGWLATPPGPVAGIVGGVALVRDRAGVRTLDVRTGRPAWHHLRAGWSLAGLGSAAGGSVVVGLWQRDGDALAIAFDAATGTRRWQRVVDVPAVDHQVTGSADLVVLVPRGRPAPVLALGVGTGERRWTWRPANAACAVVAAAPTADAVRDNAVAVAFACPDGRRVSGLAVADGSVRWTWAPASPDASTELPPRGTVPGGGLPGGYAPLLVPTAGGVLVNDGTTGLVLSMSGGRAGGLHPAGGRLAASAGPTALYLGDGTATAVDLALGRERWKVPLPAATTPVAVTVVDGVGFALVVPDRGGPARVVRYDLDTGVVAAERQVDDASTGLWPAAGTLLVTTTTNAVAALR